MTDFSSLPNKVPTQKPEFKIKEGVFTPIFLNSDP